MSYKLSVSALALTGVAVTGCAGLPQGDGSGAGEAPLLSREALFGNPTYASVQISPDGRYISYVAPDEGVLNVWVAPAEDIGAARPVTEDRGRGIRNYGWTPGGDRLVYIQDRGGDENFLLYGVDPETGDEVDYTPFENTRVQILAADDDYPEFMIIGLNNRDPRFHDAHRLNLETGELELIYQNDIGIVGYVFDNDLNLRFGGRQNAQGGFDYFSYNDGAWEPYFSVPQEDALTTGIEGFAEGNEILYLRDSRDRNTTALVAVDLASGERSVIAEDSRADIGGVWTDPETDELQAYTVTYERTEIVALNQEGADALAALEANFDGDVSLISRTRDDQHWVILETTAATAPTYHLWDREAGEFSRLFASRPELEGARLAEMHPVVITARDGLNLVSYLTLPPGSDADGDGRPETPVPMVLYVHGGPWARDTYGYESIAQWLANRGYASLQVNYRGSTGFGKDFINAAVREFAGAMHDDLIDGVDWAIAEGVTTPDQVGIMGGSYGGYATLIGMTFTPDRFACGVDIVGPSNLATLIESFPDYWRPFLEPTWYRFVGDPADPAERADMLARSAISRVDAISEPLLIGQGANDPRVVQAESDQIVAAMEERDIPVTYAVFPDEGHGFARPENRMAFFAVAEGFLGACLGGRVEPIGDDFEGSSLNVPVGADFIDGLGAALEGFTPEERG